MGGYSVEGGSKIDHQQLSYGVGKSNIHAGSGRKGAADRSDRDGLGVSMFAELKGAKNEAKTRILSSEFGYVVADS